MEEWKPVANAKNYEISNKGRVRNVLTGLILKPGINRYGYEKIHLRKTGGGHYHTTIHRLVALAWLPNDDEDKFQINHKDGNKLNNRLENLEWASARENVVHSYVHLLNGNTSHVQLKDIQTGKVEEFKSIKELGRHLGIWVSILVPLIKNSSTNPVLGKYEINLKDEAAAFDRSNTTEFGREVYVFDFINAKLSTYPSILLAAYFTGIRCLSNIRQYGDGLNLIGYFVTTEKDKIPKSISSDKEELWAKRQRYLNTPYRKRSLKYYLYDYYKKETHTFNNQDDIVKFLDTQEPFNVDYKKSHVAQAMSRKLNKSGLIKGFGAKSDFRNYDWYPYTEEIILRNKYRKITYEAYRVKTEKETKLLFGKFELCNYLGYRTDKPIQKITLEEIVQSINIPNLSVERLNKPLP